MSAVRKEISELKEEISELKEEISELKEEISDIKQDIYNYNWNHRDIRQEMETLRSDLTDNEKNYISHNGKISQTQVNHFFGIKKKSSLSEIGLYQQRIKMYKTKNNELEGELQSIQEQIKENDLQIKKIGQLLNLIEEINV
jgi:chromosome segregation ATPase